MPQKTTAVAQSLVTALLVPVSDVVALSPRPLIAQLLQDAATMSALLAHPSQRSLAQRTLIADKVRDTAALGTLPELQRTQVAACSQFMRVPSGSCVFYKVVLLCISAASAQIVIYDVLQGDVSSSVFLVLSGTCSVSIEVDRQVPPNPCQIDVYLQRCRSEIFEF